MFYAYFSGLDRSCHLFVVESFMCVFGGLVGSFDGDSRSKLKGGGREEGRRERRKEKIELVRKGEENRKK